VAHVRQRQHWLGEQVLNWSGLSVVHVRATVFLQNFFFSAWAAESIGRDSTIRLPFGGRRTSPIDADDVAQVIATILASPGGHIGKVYELTGPRSQDMSAHATEYSDALGRTITYVDVPLGHWRDEELRRRDLPHHVLEHLLTMARLHAANRWSHGRCPDDHGTTRDEHPKLCRTPRRLVCDSMTSEHKGNDENRLRARPARPAVLDVAVRKPEAQIPTYGPRG
jgi:hypothetical protein